jgi:Zn finger protein HypA/HybF involved in hydrogenase expression
LAKKGNVEIKMKSTHSRGSISCQHGIIERNQSQLNDAICEICDKVFKTDKKPYICPDCQKNQLIS